MDQPQPDVGPLMSLLRTPIVAVTSAWQGRTNAQIAVSAIAASIVPEAPRMLVQIHKDNYSHQLISASRAFAINVLHKEQVPLVRALGFFSGHDREKLATVPHRIGVTGSPILDDCLGYLDCRVVNAMDAGDMTCFLAEVVDGAVVRPDAEPLWWFYARSVMPADWLQEWDIRITGSIEFARQHMRDIDYRPWQPQ